jgi:threonine dehydrogenase-like Zn-dependent dehydrogenase
LLPIGDLDMATAALSEPLGVAVHGVRISGLAIGQRVLVLGAGTVGLMAVVAARAGGAGEVLVTARRPQQKAAALALGADRVFDDSDEGALFEAAGESPIDLVVESVGGYREHARHGRGELSPGRHDLPLSASTRSRSCSRALHRREGAHHQGLVRLQPRRQPGRLRRRRRFVAPAREVLGPTMVTHRFPLERIADAFEAAADKTSGSIKVTITGS